MDQSIIPSRLYKYRPFDSFSLRLLCESESWYARPSAFNDPLESLPDLVDDVDLKDLIALHDYFHDGSGDFVRRNYRYGYGEDGELFEVDPSDWRKRIVSDISSCTEKIIDSRGVLTLSGRWDSQLMWSHYADSHRGFCIEYDATDNRCKFIDKIDYLGDRRIRVSDLCAWKLRRDTCGLEGFVRSAYFFKAKDWAYEEEWRDISSRTGVHSAPFRVSGIIFGMRCPSQVRSAIMLTYQGSGGNEDVDFYETSFKPGAFEMVRSQVDPVEVAYIRPSASMAFGSHQDSPELPFGIDD